MSGRNRPIAGGVRDAGSAFRHFEHRLAGLHVRSNFPSFAVTVPCDHFTAKGSVECVTQDQSSPAPWKSPADDRTSLLSASSRTAHPSVVENSHRDCGPVETLAPDWIGPPVGHVNIAS